MTQVLLVDDEKNVLTTFSIGLRRHSFKVRQAQSGKEALQILDECPCDVLVSDVRMHPMDGYTLASHVRNKYPWISIVLMSAYGFDNDLSDYNEDLECPQLTKPFSVTELVRVIREEEKKWEKQRIRMFFDDVQKRIFVFGEKETEGNIRGFVEEAGFCVECMGSALDPMDRLSSVSYDLFLLDGDFLNGQNWKILNMIDQQQPGKPVILLVNKTNYQKSLSAPDLGITVIDKQAFFHNTSWAVARLLKSMESVPSVEKGY